MYKRITILLFSLVAITSPCFAGDVTFGEAKTAVSGADAQQLEVKDLDGDSKPDLIWRDSSGNLKYSLQNNAASSAIVSGFQYRIGVTIDNSNNSNVLTNYQVAIQVDTQTMIESTPKSTTINYLK
ncbi:hypothetical protein WDW89_17290 [Deltaproteobacteria bacterium TL4]